MVEKTRQKLDGLKVRFAKIVQDMKALDVEKAGLQKPYNKIANKILTIEKQNDSENPKLVKAK